MTEPALATPWRARLAAVRHSPLLKAGAWLTLASILGGALGYAYQILMGRLLSPGDFALFSAVMALFMFTGSPLNALFMVVSKRVSTLRAQHQIQRLNRLYRSAHGFVFAAALVLLPMLWLLLEPLQQWLKAPSHTPVWLFGTLLFWGALFHINNGFLQGLQHLGWLGGIGVIAIALKIALSTGLVAWGLGVSGALLGAVLAGAITWLIGIGLLRKVNTLANPSDSPALDSPTGATQNLAFSSIPPVLVANIAFAAMTQLDMVLVNAFFPTDQAGLYAAASVLGKAVLYLPGGLVLALFPLVAHNHARDQASAHLLVQSVLLVAVTCGTAALVYWLLGDWIIALFYGPAYQGAGELLRWYGFAILPLTLIMVAEHFLIAKGRVLFAWLFLAIAPVQILAIALWHNKLWHVIAIIGVFGVLLAAIGYAVLWREFRGTTQIQYTAL